MSNTSPNYEAASAEDYFSDNTQGRDQIDFLKRSGVRLEPVKARCRRPGFKKRTSSLGQRIVQHAIRKLSEAEFNAQLDKVNIPRPSDPLEMLPVVRDGVFPYISELLRQFGQGDWALRPRTFCILRILGCPEAMDSFVAMKRTDAFLPYNDRNLPDTIKGAEIRARFLRLQSLVLSTQNLNELEQEGGAHFHFRAPADDYFPSIQVLGQGGSGVVDKVYGTFTLKYFARKRIHRGISALQDQRALGSFEKELTALKAASHRHLVKLVSSYSDPVYVGLIMTPVADQDLKGYLKQETGNEMDRNAQRQCLRTFFGCLIKALEYLHRNRIIHKDIKPQNVLVKKADVYLTDFGTSKTLGEMSRSFSTGRTDEVTPRYCAPEVADQAPRGRPSDIWSMGCVFLEIATVLLGHSLDDMETYYVSHGTTSRVFWKNDEATNGWIKYLRSTSSKDKEILDWVKDMLQESQADRPTASQIVSRIADTSSEHKFFCFNCLDHEPDYSSDSAQTSIGKSDSISTSDIVTGSMLQSYIRRDSLHDGDNEDDTVTSKILEDSGVVSVATEAENLEDTTEVEDSEDDSEPQSATASETTARVASVSPGASVDALLESHVANEENATDADPSQLSSREDDHAIHREHSADAKSPQTSSTTVDKTVSPPETISTPRSSLKLPGSRKSAKDVKFDPRHHFDDELPSPSHRFLGLNADRRPLPSKPLEETVDLDEMPIVAPDPINPPPLDLKSCYPLPEATLVPSYILAGTNRFSMKEVRASDITMGSCNLFVYGRLMFPSALRAFAACSTQGVYSPMHQRRLVPSSKDWSNIDVSVKRAAEAMTPALLKDYDVWRPSRMEFAAIQDASRTRRILNNRDERNFTSLDSEPPGETRGFLILNVTEEVLRYCDLVFTSDSDSLRRARVTAKEGDSTPRVDALLQRKLVTVDVQLTSGEYRSVPTYTYVWSKGVDRLWHPWRPDTFIRGPAFQDICHVDTGDWRAEEMALAETMKIGYALVGDELCSAILADELSKLQDLLDNYDDVDARCRKYGTPLQAAVAAGNEDFVRLLLEYGANPSSRGGKYGTPLIAATVGKRRSITRILLKHRADVFASNSQYVNALYQAVGQGDWALTEMLLEAGAWLSKDYGEIKDLALERRDRDLQALLLEYDVRDAYRYRLEEKEKDISSIDRKRKEDVGLFAKYGPVTKAVLRKFLVVSSESGSLRGRKGVAITRAALAAGAPPMILDHIRNAIDPVMKLIDMLKAADKQQEMKLKAPTSPVGRVEELGSDEEDSNEEEEAKSPSIQVSGPDGKEASPVPERAVSPSSRRSSTSSVGSSRSYGSQDPRHAKKHVQFERSVRDSSPPPTSPSRRKGDTPLAYSRYERPRGPIITEPLVRGPLTDEHLNSRSRIPQDHVESKSRPAVPQIIIPSFKPAPTAPRPPSPYTSSISSPIPVSPRQSPRSPQHLHPPAPPRQRARSLDDPHNPVVHSWPQIQSNASSPSRLSPLSATAPRQWDPEQSRRRRRNDERRDEYHDGVRPRRSSDVTIRGGCGRCNGLGWYREIIGSRTGKDTVREVDCRYCGGRREGS